MDYHYISPVLSPSLTLLHLSLVLWSLLLSRDYVMHSLTFLEFWPKGIDSLEVSLTNHSKIIKIAIGPGRSSWWAQKLKVGLFRWFIGSHCLRHLWHSPLQAPRSSSPSGKKGANSLFSGLRGDPNRQAQNAAASSQAWLTRSAWKHAGGIDHLLSGSRTWWFYNEQD